MSLWKCCFFIFQCTSSDHSNFLFIRSKKFLSCSYLTFFNFMMLCSLSFFRPDWYLTIFLQRHQLFLIIFWDETFQWLILLSVQQLVFLTKMKFYISQWYSCQCSSILEFLEYFSFYSFSWYSKLKRICLTRMLSVRREEDYRVWTAIDLSWKYPCVLFVHAGFEHSLLNCYHFLSVFSCWSLSQIGNHLFYHLIHSLYWFSSFELLASFLSLCENSLCLFAFYRFDQKSKSLDFFPFYELY